MITVAVHHNPSVLPELSETVIPVQMYGVDGRKQAPIGVIGNPLIDSVKRLVQLSKNNPPVTYDL